jgi:bacterioferritin
LAGRVASYRPCTGIAALVASNAIVPHPRNHVSTEKKVSREQLIANLNEDLAREYQAIIAYVVYSQAIKGAEYMQIAKELEVHAAEELAHAIKIAQQIDYLGGEITATPKKVKTSKDTREMLRFDLEAESETIMAYRERVRECDALGEYAIAEHIRGILINEQDHLIELASALGEDPPNLSTK